MKYLITYYYEEINDDGFLDKGFRTICTKDKSVADWYKENGATVTEVKSDESINC